jgi:Skp family chaperone for outer membrane proteins
MKRSRTSIRTSLPWVLAAVATVIVFAWRADSNDVRPVTGSQRGPVALLDVAKVFKNSQKLQAELSAIRMGLGELQQELREVEQAGSAPGSGQSAEELKRLIATIKLKLAERQREIPIEESRAYADAYQSVQVVLAEICTERGIRMVFRYNSNDPNPDDRGAIMAQINAQVVYSSAPDLTDEVIAALKKRER